MSNRKSSMQLLSFSILRFSLAVACFRFSFIWHKCFTVRSNALCDFETLQLTKYINSQMMEETLLWYGHLLHTMLHTSMYIRLNIRDVQQLLIASLLNLRILSVIYSQVAVEQKCTLKFILLPILNQAERSEEKSWKFLNWLSEMFQSWVKSALVFLFE